MNSRTELSILFSCDDFSIIDKPSGLSCHNDEDCVLSRLELGFHLVHRLDKETSGVLLVTRRAELQAQLQQALHEGEKEYLAILRGVVNIASDWQEWCAPLTDSAESRDNPQGLANKRVDARTLYRAEKNNSYFSLVHCLLRTGRQHQIRKHSALAGRPVVGDSRYGNPKDNERIRTRYGFSRLALHAHRLSFQWGVNRINVVSPMPTEFASLFGES